MTKTLYYIENKTDGKIMLSARGHYFNSPTGALNSFISYYRDRKNFKEYFKGVPKGGVYSKETTENIKKIFDTYFEVKSVDINM